VPDRTGSPDPVTDLDQGSARRAEISDNLSVVRRRITDACAAAGRDAGEVTLVAVTKTYPTSDVLHLLRLGVPDIGENRDQEAAPKAAEVASVGEVCRWHFIGQLQRNKCRSVARYATLVHSVDRTELVDELARVRRRMIDDGSADGRLGILLQVSLDESTGRGGAVPEKLSALAEYTAGHTELELRGLMAVAPLDKSAESAFSRLWSLSSELRVRYPTATLVSAGMSGDLDAAIAFGATHVRIGSALLGKRATLR
jgi:pyridoxal phosphate enzyme (YggS family)